MKKFLKNYAFEIVFFPFCAIIVLLIFLLVFYFVKPSMDAHEMSEEEMAPFLLFEAGSLVLGLEKRLFTSLPKLFNFGDLISVFFNFT